jgi:hypothetical protein
MKESATTTKLLEQQLESNPDALLEVRKNSLHFMQHSGFKTKKTFTFCATRWFKM